MSLIDDIIMREKRDINPVLLKIGIISAFSLIGIFYSIFNSRRTNKPSGSSSPKAQSSPDNQSDHQSDSSMAKDELRSADDDFLPKTFDFGNSDLIVPVEDEESPSHSRGSVDSFTNSYPSSNESTCDKNVYLLPYFNEFFKEHDLAVIKDGSTSEENAENMPNPYEVEIMGLRSTIKTLNERIRSLEMKLLEYHGIKEQESYVMELQNRLKINHMEAKILHLKIKALMADKKRLEEQMGDYSNVALELETAKSKINVLEKELKREAQQNKGYLLALRDRVAKLQDDELKAFSNSEVQLMVQKTKDLEEEIEELKKTNQSLEEENSALSHKVEYLQNFATSALEDELVEEGVKKECIHLRQKNEDLASQIERLEAAHCTDVEELVYLRWINACLRYELRNHTPDGTGKTAARDLSRSLSPKSEEKAKKLILEYAQKEGLKKDKAAIISIADFDLEQWSSSHSYLTEDSDHEGDDDSSLDLSSTNHSDITRNSKIFGKLMRLVRGKHGQSHSQSTNSCIDNELRRCSSDNPNRKLSLDLEKIAHFHFQESRSRKGEKSNDVEQQQRCQRNSHDGSSYIYRVVGTTISGHEDDQHNRRLEDGSKAELVKYAEALKGSSHQKTPVRRRATSCSSFKHL